MTVVVPIDIKLIMSKIGVGAPLIGGEFEFGIFDESGKELYTATNDKSGLITFPAVHFSNPGMHHYTVKEINAPAGWDTDDTVWPIKVEVALLAGRLVATVTYPEGVPVFVNTHHSATCGSFVFPELTFDSPGVYEYTLKEQTPSGDGWTTDDTIIKVIVTVVDDGHGNLVATVEYPDEFPSFTNTYNIAPAHIIISGCKVAIGAPLPAGKFTFGLYDSEGKLVSTATNGPADETK